jgi:phage tail sheath gpL-like
MSSNAIGIERVSAVVGYLIKGKNFNTTSRYLPQRIALFGEANNANQSGLDTNDNGGVNAKEVTSAKQVGDLYGYGSPLHMMMRILKPFNNDGTGGIPIVVYPNKAPGGATAKVIQIAVSGVPNANGTHYLKIAGRNGIDGSLYAINLTTDDTAATIHQKIEDAVNAVLACPMIATSTDYEADLTSKWKGLTADGISVSVDTGDDDLGLTYVVSTTANGSGTPSITDALSQFGNNWNTIVINPYNITAILDELEAFNGIPLNESPTGRYGATVWKPFIALTGSVADDPSSITDSRDDEVTIAICPAPASPALAFEAAANMAYLHAIIAQATPHLDVMNKAYPDMPVPTDGNIGSMADYDERDAIVKKGCSTVDFVNGKYLVKDFVTTYHPDGEEPPQFRWVRNLVIDQNIRFSYLLKEQEVVVGKAIAKDSDIVSVDEVVKPKQWKGALFELADDLANRALIVDVPFMTESIDTGISVVNPDRFDTEFRYKRSGYARQSATTTEAGFNFGTLTTT